MLKRMSAVSKALFVSCLLILFSASVVEAGGRSLSGSWSTRQAVPYLQQLGGEEPDLFSTELVWTLTEDEDGLIDDIRKIVLFHLFIITNIIMMIYDYQVPEKSQYIQLLQLFSSQLVRYSSKSNSYNKSREAMGYFGMSSFLRGAHDEALQYLTAAITLSARKAWIKQDADMHILTQKIFKDSFLA